MQIESILSQQRCYCRLSGTSKKRFLTTISELIAEDSDTLDADAIYNALLAREQLGSTGVGNGIAIPHCRVPGCPRIIGALVTLDEGIDFDAVDAQSVDLIFVLIVPAEETDEHLRVLGKLAELFHDERYCRDLRQARSDEALYLAATSAQGNP